jgi:outer membrane protein TolC
VAELAVQNHQQLKVSAQNIDIAKQNTNVAKLQKLPTITASTSQFYLGDAVAIDKDFSNSQYSDASLRKFLCRSGNTADLQRRIGEQIY